jgi:hypothetical protein
MAAPNMLANRKPLDAVIMVGPPSQPVLATISKALIRSCFTSMFEQPLMRIIYDCPLIRSYK